MTVRNVWTGSMGPFQYDDTGAFKDGTPYRALRTDGSISTSALKIFGGSPAAGKVWTATNSAGDGAWQDAAGGSDPTGLITLTNLWEGLGAGTKVLANIDTPNGSVGSYNVYITAQFVRSSATQAAFYYREYSSSVAHRSDATKALDLRNVTITVTNLKTSSTTLTFDSSATVISAQTAPSATRDVLQAVINYGTSTDVTTTTSLHLMLRFLWRGYSSAPSVTFL